MFKNHKTKLYNILLTLSRNILFYKKIGLPDTYETRIYLMFIHFSILMIITKKKGSKFDQKTYDYFFHNIEYNLREMGFDFRVLVTEADENAPDHLNGIETAVWISEQKAKALQPGLSEGELGITSDTEVWLGNRRYGKPRSLEDAKEMLRSLSGKTHEVITGLTLCTTNTLSSYHAMVRVTFEDLSEQEIDHYVSSFKPTDKAGAYGIQEWIGHTMISSIEGEYNAVVGLPTSTLYRALKEYAL